MFLARDPREGAAPRVAIKCLLPHWCRDRDHVRQFLAEAQLTSVLRHPNLVHGLGFGVASGRYYLAMRVAPGTALSNLMRQAGEQGSTVPSAVALAIVSTVAAAIAHAHETRGVIHRDLSPANILVDATGAVTVIDFGVAHCAENASGSARSDRALGTLAYAAPEVLEGRVADGRADVFSLGVMLYELLAGRRLFRRDSDASTLLAVTEAPVPPLHEYRPKLSRAIDQAMLSALERAPGRRTGSALELAHTLADLGAGDRQSIARWVASLRL